MKRALVVDDSRSARVILSRMLEGYGLGVDCAESAEQALELLKSARPDVIFMDHLMPGMDGFQAVTAIKSNPETATIPVVMYTSQEGELYLSQARALGAVGVLPKTVKQSDVSRVLYQLRLLPDRREARADVVVQANGSDGVVVQLEPKRPALGEVETAIRTAMAPVLKEHAAEMRRFVLASLEAFAKRIASEAKPEPPAADRTPPPPQETKSPWRWPLAAGLAALALAPTVVLAVLYMDALATTRALMESNAQLAGTVQQLEKQIAGLEAAMQAPASTLASVGGAQPDTIVESESVPYGEPPLSGARLERLRTMIDNLKAAGFRGRIRVATYVGEFCLTGNGVEGYSIAQEDLPARRCDLRGNPFEDSLPAAQRQSLAFANLVASISRDTGDALAIEVVHEGRRPIVPYPSGEALAGVSAGEWNKIAAQNNRVEFSAIRSDG